MPYEFVEPGRALLRNGLARREADRLAREEGLRCVQIDAPVEEETYPVLEAAIYRERDDVEFRVYGHYSTPCSLEGIRRMPSLTRLCVNCLEQADDIEAIATARRLCQLTLGILDLTGFEVLESISPSLQSLALEATRSKRPSLRVLERFTALEELYLEGHRKSIDAVSTLTELRRLTLRSVTVDDLEFLRPLQRLESVRVLLGGTVNLNALTGVPLRGLELWMIRGLADIAFIADIGTLEVLKLQALPDVESLPALGRMTRLTHVSLETMKGLSDLGPLAEAPALRQLCWVAASNFAPRDFGSLIDSGRLELLSVGFGSDRRNRALERMCEERGISTNMDRWDPPIRL